MAKVSKEYIQQLVRDIILEQKADRCLRIARNKYDKPSAYRSGNIVRCRKGDIWKDIKEEDNPQAGKDIQYNSVYAKVQAVVQELLQEEETLHKWFSRRGAKGKSKGWVDCNAPDGEGGYKSCGRQEGEERSKYPSCRPTAAQCKTKGKGKTWGKTK